MISIHAPTRGATPSKHLICHRNLFQSTLPRGERPQIDRCIDVNLIFQSTLPRGERHVDGIPFKGIWDFNPRSHEGSDEICYNKIIRNKISIHAPTRGATVSFAPLSKKALHFNPRSHEGSDTDSHCTSIATQNFNPRSHEGSDQNRQMQCRLLKNFNPRSHEGSDQRDW